MTSLLDETDSPGLRAGRRQWLALGVGAAALVMGAGCPATGEALVPPADQFFFPSGMAMAPDESALFVGSSNAELSYSTGSVMVVDLGEVEALVQPWIDSREQPAGDDCNPDPRLSGLLECNEKLVVRANAGVRVGNFSSDLAVQDLESGDARLLLAVRGDPSITWIDYSQATGELECQGSSEVVPLCGEANRLRYLRDDPSQLSLIGEPFEIYVDSLGGYAMVTHQSSAAVSLVDAPPDGSPPVLADAISGLFLANSDGLRAASGIAGRLPGSAGDLVYITSRTENRVQMLYVLRPPERTPVLVASEFFFLQGVTGSDDGRGIAFGPDGEHGYIVNRQPPILHIIDTSPGADGYPQNQPAGFVEMCREPSKVVVADVGRGERAYVSCFVSGQVWVVDPRARSIEAVIEVGRGPHAMVVAPDRKRLYVANYLEDTISVVDLTPEAPTENRAVLHLGRARQSGGE